MAQEIERKFLLRETPISIGIIGNTIQQGYLSIDINGAEVRLRRINRPIHDDSNFLTIKAGAGLERTEVEIPLSIRHFQALWPLTSERQLTKRRYCIDLVSGDCIEIDYFKGVLKGLVIAEVEFKSVELAQAFMPPDWLSVVREVTDDPRYFNYRLAQIKTQDELAQLLP